MNRDLRRSANRKPRCTVISIIVAALVVVVTGFGMDKAAALDGAYVVSGGPTNSPQDGQVLTRGPIHEAFAETVTFDALRALAAHGLAANDQRLNIAAPLAQFITRKDSPLRFQPVARDERLTLAQLGQQVQQYRGERQKLELPSPAAPAENIVHRREPAHATPRRPGAQPPPGAQVHDRRDRMAAPRAAQPVRVTGPRSPIAAKPIAQLGKGQAPPKRHQVPRADPREQRIPEPIVIAAPAATVVKPPAASETPKGQSRAMRRRAATRMKRKAGTARTSPRMS